MIIFLIILLIICLVGSKYDFRNGFNDYCSMEKTNSAKGIFVIIVFLSHLRQYISPADNIFNTSFASFMNYTGQLMVVLFLFFSGYGIAVSFSKKQNYVKTIPFNRIFKTWYHFAVAVCIFEFVGIITKKPYGTKQFFIALTGWESVGNSNWFIFDILVLYCITYIIFTVTKKKNIQTGIILTTLLSAVATAVLYYAGKDPWWYNTIMCYPAGMIFSLKKDRIDAFLSKKNYSRPFCFGILFIIFTLLKFGYDKTKNELLFIVTAIIFAFAYVMLMSVISVDNKILRFFGNHIFSIYILQRIPMGILSSLGLNKNTVLFSVSCLILTIFISVLFDKTMNYSDKIISNIINKFKKSTT